VKEHEKNKFFNAIFELAHSTGSTLGMLQLSDNIKAKLCSQEVMRAMQVDEAFRRNIADIIRQIRENDSPMPLLSHRSQTTACLCNLHFCLVQLIVLHHATCILHGTLLYAADASLY